MTHDVFISYSVPDKAVADAVCATLGAKDIRCWIAPRDVTPGKEWAEAIVDAVDESRILVLVLSSASNNSPQVIREVGRAVSKGIPLVAFRIEDIRLSKSMEFFISPHQWLDAVTPPIQEHLEKLTIVVQQLLTNGFRTSADKKQAPEIKVEPLIDVFISHVEEDADIALEIALYLEQAGYSTWCYEVNTLPGPSYLIQTGLAVEQSKVVVVVISSHSLASSQVTKEVVRAQENNKEFISVLRDVTHVEFSNRQPEWREAIGAATSISITTEGIARIIGRIIDGLRALQIQPRSRPYALRIEQIRRALEVKRADAIPKAGPPNEDEILSRVRKEMSTATSLRELQRMIDRLEDYLAKYPHATHARLVKDEIKAAIERLRQ